MRPLLLFALSLVSSNLLAFEPPQSREPFEREEVVFETLNTPEPITLMAMTEDGRFLLTSHQTAGIVSVYDVLQEQFVASLETPSPRSILCRGDRIFVANFGEGTISIFSQSPSWQLVDQVEVEKRNIVHLAAPQGKHFKNELIVTCHDDVPQASYRGPHTFHLDVSEDRDRKIAQAPLANVSYDGRIIIDQSSFNLSPSGSVSGYAYRDFVSGNHSNPIFRAAAEGSQTPYIYQTHPGSYWLSNSMVFGGAPLKMLKDTEGKPLIPDLAQRIVYMLSADRLSAHRLDVSLTEIDDRRVELPAELREEFHRIARDLYRRRDYLIDHLLAYTHDETLHLFIIDYQTNIVLKARTPAFVTASDSPSTAAGSKSPSAPRPTGPATGDDSRQRGLPARVAEGEAVSVQLAGPSETRYEMLSGPDSATLTTEGRFTWQPDADEIGVHRMKIRVTQGNRVAFERPEIEVIAKELMNQADGDLADVGRGERLPLDPDHYQLVPSKDYKSLLLLQGDRLRRLDADGLTVKEEWTLPDRYRWIAERDDAWVAVRESPPRLDVIHKGSLQQVKQIPLAPAGVRVMGLQDLAIHPRSPLSYVAIKHDTDLPRYRVLIVDERTERITAPENLLGKWIAVDPAGRYLYTAYSDLYNRGSSFHINPGWRLIETPKYGSIDWLVSYNLRRGQPRLRQLVQEAGGNGQGLRLASDGKHVTYLSVVGYPPHSNNLAAFNALDFEETPITYHSEKGATPTLLAYHPTLDLVASPGGSGAVVFRRSTGEALQNRLLLTSDGLGEDEVEDLWFSPDGQSLILVCGGAEGRYLRQVGLRLSAEDKRRLVRTAESDDEAATGDEADISVARGDLDSLRPPRPPAAPATPKQIAHHFMQSVVLVQCGDSAAAGFVVGKGGFILTSAHALPIEQKVTVAYLSPKSDETKTLSAKAEVAVVDDERDLALLKIDPVAAMRPVMIALKSKPETGEQVTVIGHPGLGDEVLSHTLTTGVVSSARRIVAGQPLIQTSAAINPGNSGGPIFDSYGRVIGLVAMKANIEGTAFGVPADQVRAFLIEATEDQQ